MNYLCWIWLAGCSLNLFLKIHARLCASFASASAIFTFPTNIASWYKSVISFISGWIFLKSWREDLCCRLPFWLSRRLFHTWFIVTIIRAASDQRRLLAVPIVCSINKSVWSRNWLILWLLSAILPRRSWYFLLFHFLDLKAHESRVTSANVSSFSTSEAILKS